MLGHLGRNVPDLDAVKAYYDELVPFVGFEEIFAADDRFAYRPANNQRGTYLFFYPATRTVPYDREAVGFQHLAFMVKTQSQVRLVHEFAAQRGNTVLHPPQDFPQYTGPYYATFWLDPHGFKLEAVCHYADGWAEGAPTSSERPASLEIVVRERPRAVLSVSAREPECFETRRSERPSVARILRAAAERGGVG